MKSWEPVSLVTVSEVIIDQELMMRFYSYPEECCPSAG